MAGLVSRASRTIFGASLELVRREVRGFTRWWTVTSGMMARNVRGEREGATMRGRGVQKSVGAVGLVAAAAGLLGLSACGGSSTSGAGSVSASTVATTTTASAPSSTSAGASSFSAPATTATTSTTTTPHEVRVFIGVAIVGCAKSTTWCARVGVRRCGWAKAGLCHAARRHVPGCLRPGPGLPYPVRQARL